MPILTYIQHGKKSYIHFEGTPKLADVLALNRVYISSHCGGRGVCGKCAVYASGSISPPDERERELGVRLACRIILLGDCVVEPVYDDAGAVILTETKEKDVPTDRGWRFGAAIDIGTTTVVLKLFDNSGECLGEETALNPQRSISSDVMGRIGEAINGKLESLKNQICETISQMVESVCEKNGITPSQIDKTVITGNTAMLYLYSGRTTESLAVAPFKADTLFGDFVGDVFVAPCADAFVGADAVCSVLASDMCDRNEISLLCDIGTNGETVLYKNGKLYAVSAAAGPAFEGGEISCGCGCVSGAIHRVVVCDKEICAYTVDGSEAKGICGTGLIDAVAAFFRLGYIDKSGYASNDLLLTANGKSISLTQDDIRAFQLAKSAIRTSIDILLSRTDTKPSEVAKLYLGGGFGKNIDPLSATYVGLIPEELGEKIVSLGNSALSGAIDILFDNSNIAKSREIADNMTVFNLSGEDDFYSGFIKNIDF